MTCKHGFPAPDEAYWAGTVAPTCLQCEIERLKTENEAMKRLLEGWIDYWDWQNNFDYECEDPNLMEATKEIMQR